MVKKVINMVDKELRNKITKEIPSIIEKIKNTPNYDKMCCDCKHFRMWKPQESYCTEKKTVVNPLYCNCPMFTLRKNLRYF